MKADWQIQTPACLELIGPSQSGKSTLIRRLLEDPSVWDEAPELIIYCAPEVFDQTYVTTLTQICENQGRRLAARVGERRLPELEEILSLALGRKTVLIVDDLLAFTQGLGLMRSLATLHTHHNRISVIFCIQNPFAKVANLDLPTLSRNVTGRFVLYQVNDWHIYRILNGRLFPDRKEFLLQCLLEAKERYGFNYVFINTHPRGALPRRHICYTGLFAAERQTFGNSPLFFDLHKT